jgi:NAD(P)-dependent dehydrogenase (short-subunit alcohol dehydrogenase family)
MSERWVIVTGSSSGIGRATSLRLARSGFSVLAGVRKPPDLESLRNEAAALGRGLRIEPMILDVTESAHIRDLQARLPQLLGEGRLLGLVNDAGVVCAGPVETLTAEDWQRQYATNLFGPIALTAAIIPSLRRCSGRIVNISSIGGRCSVPFMSAYTSAKFAVEGWSDALRLELKPDRISVSLIEPGAIATAMWDKGLDDARRIIDEMPPHLRAHDGKQIETVRAATEQTARRAISAERVADVIYRALTAKRPRTRYLVGTDARVQALLKWLLPDRVMDAVLLRAMGLPSRPSSGESHKT